VATRRTQTLQAVEDWEEGQREAIVCDRGREDVRWVGEAHAGGVVCVRLAEGAAEGVDLLEVTVDGTRLDGVLASVAGDDLVVAVV
jgi:hypothetical protein